MLAVVPMALTLSFLPMAAAEVVFGAYALLGVRDEDPGFIGSVILVALVTVWSLIQYWILAVATAKRRPYHFGLGFWLAAVGSTALMATFGEGGLFGLPAAIGAAHFIAIQLLWRRREAKADLLEPNP